MSERSERIVYLRAMRRVSALQKQLHPALGQEMQDASKKNMKREHDRSIDIKNCSASKPVKYTRDDLLRIFHEQNAQCASVPDALPTMYLANHPDNVNNVFLKLQILARKKSFEANQDRLEARKHSLVA